MSFLRWLSARMRPRPARTNKLRERSLRLEMLEGRSLFATWDGNGGNGSNTVWSAWSNWNPNTVPRGGETLVFAGSRKLTNWNDLSLSVHSVIIQSSGFNIDGNAIDLGSGGIHFVGGSSSNWSIPLNIATAETAVEVSGSRTFYLNDRIFGSGGIGKYGTGTAVLNAANTFSGDTRLYSGALYLNNSAALQGSTVDYNHGGGWIDFRGLNAATFGGLKGAQDLKLANGNGGAVALTVGGNGQSTLYSGVLRGGGSLTKTGGGTFTLTAASSYTGATRVAAGSLHLAGALASSNVVVSGGTLTGGGSAKSLNVGGGLVAPGDGIGTLTINNGATFTGGTLQLELGDDLFDQLLIADGAAQLGGHLALIAMDDFHTDPDEVRALLHNAGSGATTGTFDNYADGAVVMLDGQRFVLRYGYDFDGDGNANDVVLLQGNASPLPLPDTYSVIEDGELVIAAPGVLGNDSDPNGDLLTVSLAAAPEHGDVALAADGSFVYTPHAGYDGIDSFAYAVADGQGGVAAGTVEITVTNINTPPVIETNAFRIAQGVQLDGRLHASDVDSQQLTYALVAGPANVRLTLHPDGAFSFSSNRATTASFTFTVSDGESTVQGTATIRVIAWNRQGIRPDVLEWMLENNPGLKANFLKTDRPDKVVLLPNGQSLPIYRLDQFLDVNFRLDLKSRQAPKVDFVNRQEEHMRKLMALPEFYDWIKDHSNTYQIGGRGKVNSEQAYNYFRNINRNVWVTADPRVKAPVGGGNGINAPSWAVWNKMNLLFHEVGHVINIGHNSGGLTGPLAGKMDQWDNQRRWDYSTVDLNGLNLRQ